MGKFSVVATTPDYTVKSADAELLLSTPPAITQQPARNEITKGQTANFIVKATGLALMPFGYSDANVIVLYNN
jgi:hypothetical protein